MLDIKIYGNKRSFSLAYAKSEVEKILKELALDYQFIDINDPKDYDNNILSTPAFNIENQILYFDDSAVEASLQIIKKHLFNLKQLNMKQAIKEIIVPIDYSVNADNALVYAKSMAKHLGASIRLVHVYAPKAVEALESSYILPELEKIHKERFAKYVQQLEENWKNEYSDSFTLTNEFRIGFVADELIHMSSSIPNAMIILGSKGEGSNKKLFGSVSTRVAQKAKCPVLVIPPGASFIPLESIAYCSDDESLDAMVMHKIINLAKPFDAAINLIHVGWSDNYSGVNILDTWRQHYPKSKIFLERIGAENSAEGINVYCKENAIDLLAMSRKERSFLNDLFHKSFTKQMAIYTKIPLLVTHSVQSEVKI